MILDDMMKCGGVEKYIYSDDISGAFLGNVSCASYHNNLVLIMRDLGYYYPVDFLMIKKSVSNNWICADGIHFEKIPEASGEYEYQNLYKGMEDFRLFVADDKLCGICSRPDIVKGKIIMELVDMTDFHHMCYINGKQDVEKNWAPIDGVPYRFIYNISEGVTVDINPTTGDCIYKKTMDPVQGSGSSGFILYKDHYIGIIHRKRWSVSNGKQAWPPIYEHSFVVYDTDWHLVKQSDWFKFGKYPIEFICGMCIHNNRLIITGSLLDSMPIMWSMDINALDVLLSDTISESPAPHIWVPKYIGDSYQNLSYQLYRGSIYNYLMQLSALGKCGKNTETFLKLFEIL